MASEEKQEFGRRSRAVSQGAQILNYINQEHLNRYAFVQHNKGRGWQKRFLELNPNTKQLTWWHNRTSMDKTAQGKIPLSSIKAIVHKPTSRTTQTLEEIKKYQIKIKEQQHQMMLLRKKAHLEEKIDEEEFVRKMLRQHPELLANDSDEDGISAEEKSRRKEKKKALDKEMQKKYGKWQSKRRANRENEDVDFLLAANNYLDFTRHFNERVKNHGNTKVVLKRLQRNLKKVIAALDDQERTVEDYRRILEQSQTHYLKAKKKLVDKAKKNDYILTFKLHKGHQEKFSFKTPRIAANWIEFIEDDKIYQAPESVPQHFDNYEPEKMKVEEMPYWPESKNSQSESSDDYPVKDKPTSPMISEGTKTDHVGRISRSEDPGEDSSSEEEG